MLKRCMQLVGCGLLLPLVSAHPSGVGQDPDKNIIVVLDGVNSEQVIRDFGVRYIEIKNEGMYTVEFRCYWYKNGKKVDSGWGKDHLKGGTSKMDLSDLNKGKPERGQQIFIEMNIKGQDDFEPWTRPNDEWRPTEKYAGKEERVMVYDPKSKRVAKFETWGNVLPPKTYYHQKALRNHGIRFVEYDKKD